MTLKGKATAVKALAPLAFLCAVCGLTLIWNMVSTSAPAYAVDADNGGVVEPYTIAIPSDLSINPDLNIGERETGTMTITGTLQADSTLTVKATSNGVLTSGEGATLAYKLDGADFTVRSHEEESKIDQVVTATVTQKPVCSGTYTDNVTFTITCQANTSSLILDPQGGTLKDKDTSRPIAKGETYGELPIPTRAGYKFDGWYTSATGGAQVDEKTVMSADDVTIYAHWTSYVLTIIYHSGGAQKWEIYPSLDWTNLTDDDTTMSEKVGYGESYPHDEWGLLNVSRLSREGYEPNVERGKGLWRVGSPDSDFTVPDNGNYTGFVGEDIASILGVLQQLVDGDVTVELYPVFVPHTYTVKYDGCGATGGSTASSKHVYDQKVPLTKNGFTKTGYEFDGWTDSSGKKYTDGQEVSNLTAADGATVTLYAQWKSEGQSDEADDENSTTASDNSNGETLTAGTANGGSSATGTGAPVNDTMVSDTNASSSTAGSSRSDAMDTEVGNSDDVANDVDEAVSGDSLTADDSAIDSAGANMSIDSGVAEGASTDNSADGNAAAVSESPADEVFAASVADSAAAESLSSSENQQVAQ